MAAILKLSESGDARHADVLEAAKRLPKDMAEGLEVAEVVVIYTTNDGETLNYHYAGGNRFRMLYLLAKLHSLLLEE